MIITDQAVEVAAKAAYAKVCECSPRHYGGTQLERFIPWEEIAEGDWKTDYRSTIRAALDAGIPFVDFG